MNLRLAANKTLTQGRVRLGSKTLGSALDRIVACGSTKYYLTINHDNEVQNIQRKFWECPIENGAQ
jgi:hypothetical protein